MAWTDAAGCESGHIEITHGWRPEPSSDGAPRLIAVVTAACADCEKWAQFAVPDFDRARAAGMWSPAHARQLDLYIKAHNLHYR